MRRLIISAAACLCAVLLLVYIHAYEAGIRHALQDSIITHSSTTVSILLDGELWFHEAELTNH